MHEKRNKEGNFEATGSLILHLIISKER